MDRMAPRRSQRRAAPPPPPPSRACSSSASAPARKRPRTSWGKPHSVNACLSHHVQQIDPSVRRHRDMDKDDGDGAASDDDDDDDDDGGGDGGGAAAANDLLHRVLIFAGSTAAISGNDHFVPDSTCRNWHCKPPPATPSSSSSSPRSCITSPDRSHSSSSSSSSSSSRSANSAAGSAAAADYAVASDDDDDDEEELSGPSSSLPHGAKRADTERRALQSEGPYCNGVQVEEYYEPSCVELMMLSGGGIDGGQWCIAPSSSADEMLLLLPAAAPWAARCERGRPLEEQHGDRLPEHDSARLDSEATESGSPSSPLCPNREVDAEADEEEEDDGGGGGDDDDDDDDDDEYRIDVMDFVDPGGARNVVGRAEPTPPPATARTAPLGLALDYEDVIESWPSDRGPPWAAGHRPDRAAQFELALDLAAWEEPGLADDAGTMTTTNASRMIELVHVAPAQHAADPSTSRRACVLRYHEKRHARLRSKTAVVRYEVRKLNAQHRPRLKGRFVRRSAE